MDLVFEPTDWNIPQTIHVGCIDDLVDELQSHTASLILESTSEADAYYNQAPRHAANVTITDNDVALVSVYAPFANTGVPEGTRSSYKMWLETKPTDDVTITVSGSQVDVLVGSDGTPGPTAEVVFTPTSWSVPQEVVIQATDDFDIERTDNPENARHHQGTIQHAVSSDDPFYDSAGRGDTCTLPTGLPVFVNVVDNDDPRVFMSRASVAVTEGASVQMYIVKLLARPTKDVFFDVLFDPEVLQVEPSVLTFSANGWDPSTQAVVSVSAVDDHREQTDVVFDIDGIQTVSIIEHRVRSEDPFYSDPAERELIEPPLLPVTVTDNDYSGVLIDPADNYIVVRENGMLGEYNVRLATQPYSDVFLYISPGNLTEAVASGHEIYTVNSSLLVFTEDSWNDTQTVLVAAVDDTEEEEMCSEPLGEYGLKLPQLVRHLMITADAKYLPGCGAQQHDCSTRSTQFALQSECEAACKAPYDPMNINAPSEKWCGGCLRFYNPSAEDLVAGCPPVVNSSVLPERCYKFEPRQGIYYEGSSFPAIDDEDDAEFVELMRRRNDGDYNTRWATKATYVVDDDSSLLTPAERISDISERTTVHNWASLPNVTMYAGIPSELIITSFDRCEKMVTTDYDAVIRLTTSDGHVAPLVADSTHAPQYSVDVMVGPTPFVLGHVELLIGDLEAPIQRSPIFMQVLPGPAHFRFSYVLGLAAISTSETATLRVYWFDEFGSPTNLVCRPSRRHTLPIEGATSDCNVGESMHNSVFQVSFLNTAGEQVAATTFTSTQYGWCDDISRVYGYEKPQCLADQAGGSSTVVEYTSESPGDYLLLISVDGEPITGSPPGRDVDPSPYRIAVSPGPTDISQCYAEGTGASNARAGDQTMFLIKLADQFGNVKSPLNSDPITFECLMASESDSTVVVGVVSPQDNGYICVYTVEVAGAYTITVKAAPIETDEDGELISTVKQHISTSPIALDVKPAHPDPGYFLVKAGDGSELSANPVTTAGDLVQFQVLAMDQFENPSTMLCNATFCEDTALPQVARTTLLHGVEIEESVTVADPVDGGIYPVEFEPTISGVCRVEVVVDGQHVPQSPFQITVLPSELDPSMTLVEGGGTEGGVAGFPSLFEVRLRDTYGNPVEGNDATLQAGVLQSNTHCFNVTNETFIPVPTDLGVQDINCTSQDERIKVPVGCSESWQNATPACAIPVDCVGRFSEWTPCSDFENPDNPRTCGFGTKRKHYIIDREARNGGYECDYSANDPWEESCAMVPCEPVTTCVDPVYSMAQEVAGTSEADCELTGNTWSAGGGDPTCVATHLQECAAVTSSLEDCVVAAGGGVCSWDGSLCAANDVTPCSDQSLNGEAACLNAGDCVYTEDGTCADPDANAVVASTEAACERNGNIWACTEHCDAECSRTGPGLTGQPDEPSIDMECLVYFGWQSIPPARPVNRTNTTGPVCEASNADDCADATTAAECAAAAGGGACSWKSDGSCRSVHDVECRTALREIGSKNVFHPEFGTGQFHCERAGACVYDPGTDNITLIVLPYRQMWCEYCYEVTDSSPVTALTDGSVQEFQYEVDTPGDWEIVIVMTVDSADAQQDEDPEEAFHFHNVATILSLVDADANATMSTIEGLTAAVVNETFTFYLQARTAQGINLVRGNDPFEIQFGPLVLDATNDEGVVIANETETVRASFEDSGDGVYSVTVWTIAAGRYDVVPSLNNGQDDDDGVDMGIYSVNVLPGETDPEHSVVTRRSVRYAGQEMYIEIKARDIFSNDQVYSQFDGPDPFEVVADGPGPVSLHLDDFNNGIYRTRWGATISGLYTLNISLHSVQIEGSPVRVHMGPAPVSGATSTAAGIGLGAGGLDADTPTSFSVQLRDAFGNRGILVPELMHVALIGIPRQLYLVPTPAAIDPPTIDEDYQLTLESASLAEHLFDCDGFKMIGNDGATLNATAFGIAGAYVLNDLSEWAPMYAEEGGVRMTFPLTPVHGVRLSFSNSSTTNEDGSRTIPTGIHPTEGLVFSCAKPLNATLIPDDDEGNHALHYHATIAGNYNLRINLGRELITDKEYPVVVSPGEFNESTSSSSIPALESNITTTDDLDEDTPIDPTWPTTVAGRVTSFSIVVRDSYNNELTGGDGLLAATLELPRPRTILRMDAESVGGHYSFRSSPTRVGVYFLSVLRMGIKMETMTRVMVVLPAEPYAPLCRLERHGGALLDNPITGQVNWHIPSYPILTSRHSYHLDAILYDQFGNAIEADFADTGYSVNVTVTSDEPHIIDRGAQSMTDTSQGQVIHTSDGNPVGIRLSTLVAGSYRLYIEFVSPENTSLPVKDTPFALLAQPKECVGSWSEFTVQRESDFVAGELFEIGLAVKDAFSNPCTPELLEVSVETTESLQTKADQRLETPSETQSRESREAQIINNALQTGFIATIDEAPRLFMTPGRVQWLHTNFEMQSVGQYKYTDIPTVVGQYGFMIKVNNATVWLHVSGRGKTSFELDIVATENGRVESPQQIESLLNLVAVTVRPGPASPHRSFLSGMQDTEVDIPTQLYVHTMDAFDNLVDGTFATICTKIVRVDAPVASSMPEEVFLNAAPVIAETANAGGNIFNITMSTTVSGIYQTQVFVFDGGPANIGDYRDCPTLLAAEEEDKYALKPKLASLCPQYNFAQLSDDGLCTSPLAYGSDETAFAQIDTDGDGVLSRDEVSTDHGLLLAGGVMVLLVDTEATAPSYVDDLMAVLDSNSDGLVMPEEFSARWAIRMKLPELQVLPGVAAVATSSALGNGLRGGFRGDPLRFKVEIRDRFGNLRSFNVRDTLEIYAINVNASALAGVWRRGYDMVGELPAALRALVSRHPGLELNGCEVGNCVSTLAAFDYSMFNGSATGPGGQFTETARSYRQFDSGIYSVTYTPQTPDVYHMCIFINEVRLPIELCDFACSPTAVTLTDELRVPTLLSVTDAEDEVIRAGTAMQVIVQLRNEIGYDLNFGGYTGALIVGMEPDVGLCVGVPVICQNEWLSPIPFEFGFLDRADGSYAIDYVPTLPGNYNLSIMVNLTHGSLPVIPCTEGLLSCVTRFEPVCGYDLRTYPNECFAQNECVDVAYQGECVFGKPIPIPWIQQPLAEYSVVVLPSGTSPEHSVVTIKESYMCPLGICYRLKTLRATSAAPPRHVGLSTRRAYCDTPDHDLAMERCPGQTFEFRVQAHDSFGNVPEYRPREENFAGTCVGPVTVPFETRNTGENGTYFYTAQLTVSGDYIISLTMNGEDVGASSFWLSVDSPHYWVAEQSSVVSHTAVVVAGDTASLFLRPRGEYGNALYSEPAPGPLADGSVMLNFNPPTSYTKSVASWDRINGTVMVSYTVRNSGVYTMNVSFFQTVFAMDTINIVVIAGRAVASQCVAYGPGLMDGVAGAADRTVFVDAKDGFGNYVMEPDGIENFIISVDHTDAKVYQLWGFGRDWVPVHNGEQYTATLAAYSAPVYTYTYTALPAGSYATVVSLGEIDLAADNLVPYREDMHNGYGLDLQLASAPLVARLQFRDTGSHIELEFDRPTNKARQPQPESCLELIDATNVAQFGTGSSCRWLSSTTILVTLGGGATVLVGDMINVKPGVILSSDENSHASSDATVLAIPANMPAPVVTLAAPTTLGQCDDLLLDASGSTGSGGRAMGYTYTALAGVGANLAAVYDALHLASCPPLSETPCNQAVVSADTLVAGKTYTFTVTVSNFWGASGSATAVIYKTSQPTPKVLISGPTTKNVRSSDKVPLSSDVELSSCYNGDAQMSFEWTQLPGSPTVTLDPSFVASREIQISDGSLQAGQTYTFSFRGAMEAQPGIEASAEVDIVVSYSDLDVEIVGGSRSAPVSRASDVSVFVADPEDQELQSSISYEWGCEPVAAPGTECATTQAFHNLQSTAAEVLTLSSGVLPPAAYRFTVTATKDPGFRSSTASAVITLVSDPILDVFVERQLPVGIVDATFSSSDRLILNRKVYGNSRPVSCMWAVDHGLDMDAEGVLGTTRSSTRLVVRPDHLTELVYTFTLTCTEISLETDDELTVLASGSAQYTVNVNTPPSSGTLRLKDVATHQDAVSTGINVMDAQLEISAENWVDEAAHMPLSYEFRKSHPGTADREVVLARASSPTIVARLPAGKVEDDYQVRVVLYVSDRYGATARTEMSIQIFPVNAAEAMDKATELMGGGFADAKKTGDVREMLQFCTLVGDMLGAVGGAGRRLQADQQGVEVESRRRAQTQAEIDIVSEAITSIKDAAASVPLDATLVGQFFSGIESQTILTHLLTPASIEDALDLVEFLLDASDGASISDAVATDAATALQNMLHAVLVSDGEAPWSEITTDPAAAANVDMQVRMDRIDTLVTRVGLALLPSIECGESAQTIHPTARSSYATNDKWAMRQRLFELSARKLCVTANVPVSVGHEDSALENPTMGSTVMSVSTSAISNTAVDAVTTVFYNSLTTPSELPKSVPDEATYPMANLSSPVVSTRLYSSTNDNEFTFGVNFAPGTMADTYVQRGEWAYDDPTTTTTLCGYFQPSTNSWQECEVVSSDIAGTTCRCPVTTLVATMRSASECIENTNCFTCLSNPKCGWCPGYDEKFSGEVPGAPGYCYEGNLQAEFYPGTCGDTPWGERKAVAIRDEVDAWSYDSCPCESFKSCGDCMLDNDPFTGKTKRSCGYCPESKQCLAAGDATSCTDWYIDFVLGMQAGTKPDVTPADGVAWQEVPALYDPYPGNCPLNCSITWGNDNGYSIPGCVNGACMDYVNCVCEPGYWSLDCSRMCPGGATNPCTGHGQCDAGATGSGQCFCNEGYGGSDCQDCDNGHWGPECLNECRGGGDTPCSGNGICSSGEAGTGECTCYRGYYGEDCSSYCPGARDVPQRICAANGNCADGPSGDGKCSCWAGYYGTGCEGQCPRRNLNPFTGQPELDDDGVPTGPICSGPTRGTCSDGSTGSGVCQCLPSFYGVDCSGQCPGSTPSGNQSCTGRGVCSDGSQGTGLCSCLDGYRGARCEDLPIRVRVAIALDVSQEEWLLYQLDEMLYDGLASALGVGGDGLLPITVLIGGDELTVYFEIASKGFDFATDVLLRLNDKSAADLIDVIRLPVISYTSDTHVGAEWPCGGVLGYGIPATAHMGSAPAVPPLVDATTGGRCYPSVNDCVVAPGYDGEGAPYVEPTFYCNARGSCNATMGTCVCDTGYAGTDCDTKLTTASRPPIQIAAEETVTWLSNAWPWLVLGCVTVAGVAWYGVQKRKQWAERIREMRAKPVGLDAAEARHWMSLRRMATGRTAADAFIVGPGGQTTGAAARNVWDISLRAATPESEDGDARPMSAGLGSGWLAAWPGGGGV
jgi:hypothetical protein